jgi:hypothetical protein
VLGVINCGKFLNYETWCIVFNFGKCYSILCLVVLCCGGVGGVFGQCWLRFGEQKIYNEKNFL